MAKVASNLLTLNADGAERYVMVRIMRVIGPSYAPPLPAASAADLMNLMNFAKCQTVVIRLAMQGQALLLTVGELFLKLSLYL